MFLTKAFHHFFKLKSSSGMLLLTCALFALLISNSPLNAYYQSILATKISLGFGNNILKKPMILWINDGLMVFFFLLVSLEIKREMLFGELSVTQQRILPAIGALGGMVVPAGIYIMIVMHQPDAIRGWAIPTATDIAFSLAVLSLFSKRLPNELKIFLTALAILDDLGAIIIIALFYTSNLYLPALGFSFLLIASLFILNKAQVNTATPYYLISILLWFTLLKSGVHTTLVGVVLAMALPMQGTKKETKHSLGMHLEHNLTPWVSYCILPIFACANSGVPLENMRYFDIVHSIPVAIACGLCLGKPIGIFTTCFLAVKLKFASLPKNVNWPMLFGISALCGIGFTMSLFIGSLAFETHSLQGSQETVQLLYTNRLRIGVLAGSLISGLMGYAILAAAKKTKPN
jgi:Na+:H+ antiporter, NhaA family